MVSISDQQMSGGAACAQTRWETFGQSLRLGGVGGRGRCWKGSSLSHGSKKPNGIAWGRRKGTSCFCYYVSAHNLKKTSLKPYLLYLYITGPDVMNQTQLTDKLYFKGLITVLRSNLGFFRKMFICLFSVWPDVTGLPTLKRAWRQSSAEWWGICEVWF